MNREPNAITIVGAGTIGTTVCADLRLHGFRVTLIDILDAALERAQEEITRVTRFAPALQARLPNLEPSEVLAGVRFSRDLRDAAGAELVIENVDERWEVKREVYQQLDAICAAETVFAPNTSCTSIAKIGALTRRPQNVVGVHFMNPAYLTRVIEVIRTPETSNHAIDLITQLAARLGKEVVTIDDFPGFASNRIFHVFLNEAVRVVEEQGVAPVQLDRLFRLGFGHRMGPLETADLIGIDTVVNSLDVLYDSYRDQRFQCTPLLRRMVAEGLLGRKNGKGFYEYL